jgi:hypothetical protein
MWIRKTIAFFVIFSFVSLFFHLPPNDWLVDHVQYTMCSNDAHRKIMFRSCATIKKSLCASAKDVQFLSCKHIN